MSRAHTDPSMELHRKLNPDWRFSDTTTYLLAEIASIESSRRYFQLAQVMEEVPKEYWPATYGPAHAEPDMPEVEPVDVEGARKVAADLINELVA